MRANGASSALVSTVGGPEVKPALCLLRVGEEVIYHQNSGSASNSVSFRCVSRGPLDKRLHENVHQGINKRLQESVHQGINKRFQENIHQGFTWVYKHITR